MSGPWPMTTVREGLAVVIAEAYYMNRYEVEIPEAWKLVADAALQYLNVDGSPLASGTNDSIGSES